MTTEQAIGAYLKLTSKLFSEVKRNRDSAILKATVMESEFSAIVRRRGLSVNTRMQDSDLDENSCKM